MLFKVKKIDWPILLILILFMGASTLVIKSAILGNTGYTNYDMKNLVFYCLGFIVLLITSFIDYRIWVRFSIYIYLIGVILLVTVYFFGTEINGAKGWFELPYNLLFQPAELVKLTLIISIAWFISRRNGDRLNLGGDVIPLGLIAFIPFVLVLIQPDLGNAIIYLVIFLGMAWIGNIKYTYVLIGTAAIIAFLFMFIFLIDKYHDEVYVFLESKGSGHWLERIDTFIDPDNSTGRQSAEAFKDSSYQVTKSKIAIGSGGLSGDGYLKGNSLHEGFIPFPYSDSIFVVIGEEFGFVGSSVLLLLYFLLIYRMILIAIQTVELSGVYIIIGVVSMFVFQIFENIGMLIGIMPLTGITLPFISYGGSSLLINMICIGIVLSIKMHQKHTPVY
ncbi:MAG TPA: FtsW/RodA/SpoVE family cell cycle protein [Bacilli bacterium]